MQYRCPEDLERAFRDVWYEGTSATTGRRRVFQIRPSSREMDIEGMSAHMDTMPFGGTLVQPCGGSRGDVVRAGPLEGMPLGKAVRDRVQGF